jgi:sterol desaturase/sphingolipid hydroxylase (fatty acid hydroxylase superfamily)
MENVIDYFNSVSDVDRILFFAGITFFVWNIELFTPLYKNYNKWRHAVYNLLFVAILLPVQYFMGFLINNTLQFIEDHHFGILNVHWFKDHPIISFLVGFMLLDLGEYIYHYIMHQIKSLWLFHAVHHMEENVDVSTTVREHPMETSIRLGFTLCWILLIGIPFWILAFRQFIQIASNLFAHTNFRFSKKTNALLSTLFITPNLHHIHHHFERPYTDRNYGDVLSIWDRLFGTFYNGDLVVKYGVDTFQHDDKRRKFMYLFTMPFKKQYKLFAYILKKDLH